jgi:LysM repeat protein
MASLVPAAPRNAGTASDDLAPKWADSVSDGADSVLPPDLNESAQRIPPASAVVEQLELPDMPAIPELPPLGPTSVQSDPPAMPPNGPPVELPADIPTARYPGEATTAEADFSQITASTTASISQPASVDVGVAAIPEAPPSTMPGAVSPELDNTGRYGSMLSEESSTGFAAAWPEIQASLARQELAQAHQMLSQWYGNPALSPTETNQVEALLGQLAGTVVYSTDHRLEPPYVVRIGDTLETIAERFEVPWQLLAKINGIPAATLIQPGQQLKVVHGPFAAVVELSKQQLTLALDGRYAGRFPIIAEPGAENHEGQWVLEQKLNNPATGAGSRVLVLRSNSPLGVGEAISITDGSTTTTTGPTAVAPPAIRLSAQDAEDLAGILSVGSRVVIRR